MERVTARGHTDLKSEMSSVAATGDDAQGYSEFPMRLNIPVRATP